MPTSFRYIVPYELDYTPWTYGTGFGSTLLNQQSFSGPAKVTFIFAVDPTVHKRLHFFTQNDATNPQNGGNPVIWRDVESVRMYIGGLESPNAHYADIEAYIDTTPGTYPKQYKLVGNFGGIALPDAINAIKVNYYATAILQFSFATGFVAILIEEF
jgi:hypothetical protein